MEGNTEFVAYRVAYDEGLAAEDPPGDYDLILPPKETAVLNDIVARLKLSGEPPRKIIKEIQSFFRSNFRYSLELTGPKKKYTALSHFLMHSRSGHCEYFASATVLLLRAAGLPARYARGYSVHEFSKLERQYLVRDRHAHAWALVYLDGAWHDVDTTPGSWIDTDNAAASGWQSISDLWSWCRFKLSQAVRWVKQSTGLKPWLAIALLLMIFPAGRFLSRKRLQRAGIKKSAEVGPLQTAAGLESGFYLIEKALIRADFARRSSESMANWIARLPQHQFAAPLAENLKSLLDLHYRFRFDPRGINDAEKSYLISAARSWLIDFRKAQSGLKRTERSGQRADDRGRVTEGRSGKSECGSRKG